MLNSALTGAAHTLRSKGAIPFMVGQVDSARGYVHVLDDTTLNILLETLDTVADFLVYLRRKEQFITSGIAVFAAGEEELLAHYLTHCNAEGEYDFVFDEGVNEVVLVEGLWQDFMGSPQRAKQREANEISYVWDDIIERTTKHFLRGTSQFLSDTRLSSQEWVLRFFAREPRLRRRMLMSTVVDMVKVTRPDKRGLRVVPPSRSGDPYYVLLAFPKPAGVSERRYRDVRRRYLEACCGVVRLRFTDALDIVGLATETLNGSGRSEDLVYFDGRVWTEEMAKAAEKSRKALSILTNATEMHVIERDYPA